MRCVCVCVCVCICMSVSVCVRAPAPAPAPARTCGRDDAGLVAVNEAATGDYDPPKAAIIRVVLGSNAYIYIYIYIYMRM